MPDASTLEKELNSNAQLGWRLHQLPRSPLANSVGSLLTRVETGKRYQYKVLATRRVSTIEKEFAQAAAEGWEFRGLASRFDFGDMMMMAFTHVGSESFMALERETGETKRRFEYRILSAQREKTIQQELDQAVAEGYLPLAIAGGQDTSGAMVLLGPKLVFNVVLSRSIESLDADKGRYEYRFLRTAKVNTLDKDMNQAAKEGFRYYLSTPPLAVLMRREKENPAKGRYEYHLLATLKKATMEKEMNEQGSLGYHYVATGAGLGIATFFEHDTVEKADAARRAYLILKAARDATIGIKLPVVLSLQKENQIYRVVGHKTPRDGSQYWHDIETLFPARTHEEIDALIGGPNFWREELEKKASKYFQQPVER